MTCARHVRRVAAHIFEWALIRPISPATPSDSAAFATEVFEIENRPRDPDTHTLGVPSVPGRSPRCYCARPTLWDVHFMTGTCVSTAH